MIIELTNRSYWLERIKRNLEEIHELRAKKQREYDSLPWWKQWYVGNPKDRIVPYYWHSEAVLSDLQQALLSENTGVIYVTSEELERII